MKTRILKILSFMIIVLGIYKVDSLGSYVSNDPKVNCKDTFSITVTSTEGLENYNLSLGDHSGLTYKGCSANGAAVNSSAGKIGYASIGSKATNLGTFTFEAPDKAGTYTVKFNINGETNTSTVTVSDSTQSTEPSNQSANNTENKSQPEQNTEKQEDTQATLTSITVNGKTYKNPNKDITVNVENDVESVEVKAVSSDGSSVSGVGTVKLKVGTNTVKLKSDNSESYTVRIRRLESLENEEPNIIEEQVEEQPEEEKIKLELTNLKIEKYKLTPAFKKDVYSYTINIDMDKEDTDKLNITAIASDPNAKVEITGNDNLKEGENIINIILANDKEEDTVTYQIKVNKIIKSSEVVSNTNNNEIKDDNETRDIIIAVIAIVGAVLGIIFAVIEYRYTNKDEDENNIFDFDKENMKQDNINSVEEIYKDKNIVEKYYTDDIDEKPKKKRKGKHF